MTQLWLTLVKRGWILHGPWFLSSLLLNDCLVSERAYTPGKTKCFILRWLLMIMEVCRIKRTRFLFFPNSSIPSHPRLLQFTGSPVGISPSLENILSNPKHDTNWFYIQKQAIPHSRAGGEYCRVVFSWEPLLKALNLQEKVENCKYITDPHLVASRETENLGQTRVVLAQIPDVCKTRPLICMFALLSVWFTVACKDLGQWC